MLNLVCVRLRDDDSATRRLVDDLNASGRAQVTPTVLDGRSVLRFCVGSHLTERRHVEAAWMAMGEFAGSSEP